MEWWRQPQQTCVLRFVGDGLDPLVYARLRYLLLRFLRICLRFRILSAMTAGFIGIRRSFVIIHTPLYIVPIVCFHIESPLYATHYFELLWRCQRVPALKTITYCH